MPGGLMELIAVGGLDQYIMVSPEISYFKAVYKRHTNFAMENIRQSFQTSPVLTQTPITVASRVTRIADLLSNVYFSFRLPAIYSSAKYRFRWIKNIGEYIIYKYSLRMDSQLIDEGYGEWIELWNELSMPAGKRANYDDMIGNIQEMNNPVGNDIFAIVENNNVSYTYYPQSTDPKTPSIFEKRLIVPIPFWFTKNPALALPLVALQYQNVDIILELRGIEDLYQVWDDINDMYVSPARYRSLYPNDANSVSIGNFLTPVGSPAAPNLVDIDGSIECTFTFLDNNERRIIATSTLDYLVERVYRSEMGGISSQGTINLTLTNPIKEFIWFGRRGDIAFYNDWTNFTAAYPENKRAPILKTGKFLWNGNDRIEEKTADFFNKIQPFRHHTNSPRQGIYCYSHALYPEKWQPSGSFNASMLNRIQLFLTTDQSREYTFVVYTLYYNIFHVVSGTGGMVSV